jgi:putative tryptophan/tyrosine transport system substrate-binding protein
MRRREFIRLSSTFAVALPYAARAQVPNRVYRIGFLRIGPPPPSFIEPFRQGLKDLGYVEGQNLTIEFGLAKNAEQLPEVADALVRRNVDLIVASGAAAVLPARDAARGVPVIFIAGIDPITLGLASKGLAQGGANITGLTTVQIDLTAKRMQLLKEMLPSLTSVAFLLREANPGTALYVAEAERAAQTLGMSLHLMPTRSASDFEQAFRNALAFGAAAVVPMDDAAFTSNRRELVELAERYKLPGVYAIREFVAEGGLISLGPKYKDVYRRAATYVDKILKGTNPADLPVEQPTTFEVVINLKTAAALGIAIPPTLLARADEVIE